MAYGGDLEANTAVDLMVGPFLDSTDGDTEETGLTITQAEVRLSKNGGNTAQKNEATSLVHDELGNYVCKLDATDTNAEGILTLMIHESGSLSIKMDYTVLSQAAYISKYTAKDAGFMDINIKTIGRADAQETEADNLETATANYSATRGLTGTAVPAAAADAIGGLPISDAGGLDLDTQLATTDQIGAAGAGLTAINLPNQTMDIIGSITGNLSGSVGSVTGAVGSVAGNVDGSVGSVTGHTNQTGDNFAIVNGSAGLVAINTDVEAILVDTGEIGTAGAGLTDITVNAASVTAIWAKAMSDLAQGAPSATASVLTAINYLYESWRNKTETTATRITIFKDDAATELVRSTISDDATTFTKGEIVTGA